MKKIILLLLLLTGVQLVKAESKPIITIECKYSNASDTTHFVNLKNDNEFTPEGHKQWDKSKYFSKINNLAKVIAASSNTYPDFIGVCEIENEKVLNDLFRHPILQKQNYQIIHLNKLKKFIQIYITENNKTYIIIQG